LGHWPTIPLSDPPHLVPQEASAQLRQLQSDFERYVREAEEDRMAKRVAEDRCAELEEQCTQLQRQCEEVAEQLGSAQAQLLQQDLVTQHSEQQHSVLHALQEQLRCAEHGMASGHSPNSLTTKSQHSAPPHHHRMAPTFALHTDLPLCTHDNRLLAGTLRPSARRQWSGLTVSTPSWASGPRRRQV
jgi:hypothetical protein